MSQRIDEQHAAVALASLPGMTPMRLRSLLNGRRPAEAVAALNAWSPRADAARGPLEALLGSTSAHFSGRRLGDIWQRAYEAESERTQGCAMSGPCGEPMTVHILGDSDYPERLARDPRAPAVLFSMGDLGALSVPCAGIVGTRHATAYGRACSRTLGDALCRSGVAVVSGLARGIDVSAHRGVVDVLRTDRHVMADGSPSPGEVRGRPIGVVASGLDVVYPPEHGEIWNDVAREGVLISESPPGTEPHAHRFPLRNRIIAALCDVLVVVESRITGGSMITVREALDRGITVMAVPGATSTRAAEGTNALIRDGASIAVEPEDVLAVLGMEACRRSTPVDFRPPPSSVDRAILEVIGSEPMTLDEVVGRMRTDLADVAVSLGRLEAQGWLLCTAGWYERLSQPGA